MKPEYARHQNQYADSCRVCGAAVPAGEGWLYSDTRSVRSCSRRRSSGRWNKYVKCARCHMLKAAHRCDLPENQPVKIARPKIGVSALRQGKFQLGTYRSGVWTETGVYLELEDGRRQLIAQLTPIDNEPVGIGFGYEDGLPSVFGGCVLTPAAERELVMLGDYAAELYAEAMLSPRDAE